MPETIIESVLNEKLDRVLLIKWLNNETIEDDCILLCCKKSEFVARFLSYLRNQTDRILQTNSNAVQILHNSTPEKVHSSRRKHHRSISEPTSDDRDSLSVKTEKSHESPNRDKKRPGRKVKTKLFPEDRKETSLSSNLSVSSDESRLSISVDRIAISSTPLKNGVKASEYPNLPLSSPVTPRSYIKDGERCDTPRLTHRHSRSHEKSCLGDFIVTATKSSKKKTKKNISNENEERIELDLSNSEMFPEIGARKASSLRGEKKRIKPTNIDKSQKSLSLNSFNAECFNQLSPLPLEDTSFKKFQPKETSNSFEVERNILKQERHKLMEKFNILNTAPQKVAIMPQIKISQKESIEQNLTYIKADVTKILSKDKIDLLIEIYDNLLKNNLILSVITEVYFLISILISKQLEDDYLNVESQLMENNIDYLLKSIHNSSYFAVKSLWNLRTTLEVILEKSSLKTLGENKKVRSFYPDLAKFLLNCYCLRCESGPPAPGPRPPAVVCYNMETDSADNFPGTQAFHNFKKQRDMFYEIVRWYVETQSTGGSKSTFRARLKALTSLGSSPANHAHLAELFLNHMLAECLPANTQESKLSKLQRRLTCPSAPDSHRLPSFTSNEMFYKEFIMHAEHESFRTHLKDAIATEIVAADSAQFAVEDRGNANIDITREYQQLAKKLVLLAKFLGYTVSLPYSPIPTELTTKTNNIVTLNKEQNFVMPKEKVLENSLALRNYSQPTIDIKGLLQNAIDNSRLSITIPWLVNYLSMLDYTTLHTNYYQAIIKTLLDIYHTKLLLKNENQLKKNTIIYLKSILGWFFDLPHCSQIDVVQNSVGTDSIDSFELVDESIFELCPCLRDVNTLLSTCKLVQKDVGSFKHITPVSLSVDPLARTRSKEKELQARLEEELVKSQPSSTRRVLEMVIERVTSAAVRELTARELVAARTRANEQVAKTLQAEHGRDHVALLSTVTSVYAAQLHQLRAAALESSRAGLAARTRAALTALLPAAPAPLHSVACRAARNRLSNWIDDHWNTTAVLCKDIESEMKTLLSLNEMRVPSVRTPTLLNTARFNFDESPATVLIHLKEHICLLLDDEPTGDISHTLAACADAASHCNVFCRAPTQRALMQLSVDLALVYVSRKPKEVTESFLLKLHTIWHTCVPDRKHHTPENLSIMERREDLSPELRNFTDDRLPTPISDDESKNVDDSKGNLNEVNISSSSQNTESQATKNKCTKHSIVTQNVERTKTVTHNLEQKESIEESKKSRSVTPKCVTKNSVTQNLEQKDTIEESKTTRSQTITPKRVTKNSVTQNLEQKDTIEESKTTRSQTITPKRVTKNSVTQNLEQKETIEESKNSKTPKRVTKNSITQVEIDESNEQLLEFFDRILCPRNIVMLSVSKCDQSDVWEALAVLLVFLLKNDYLSEDSLTEQCLAVYRQDWTQPILENLSACMKAVSTRWSRSSTGKFTLFLDFLAEYCGDMDYEINE